MHYDKCCLEPCVLLGHANLWSFQSFQPPVLSKHLHLSMNSRGAAPVASKNHNTLIEDHCRMTLRRSLKGGSSHLRPCLGLSSKRKASERFGNEDFKRLLRHSHAWTCEARTKMAQKSLDCTNVPLGMDIKGKKCIVAHLVKDSFLYDIQKTPLRIERTSRSSCQKSASSLF